MANLAIILFATAPMEIVPVWLKIPQLVQLAILVITGHNVLSVIVLEIVMMEFQVMVYAIRYITLILLLLSECFATSALFSIHVYLIRKAPLELTLDWGLLLEQIFLVE